MLHSRNVDVVKVTVNSCDGLQNALNQVKLHSISTGLSEQSFMALLVGTYL